MKKQIEIEMPTGWGDVKLKDYLVLQAELESYDGEEEAQTAIMMHHICGLEIEQMKRLSTESFLLLKKKIDAFVSEQDFELQRIIKINGIEYGFEPNLSQMAYGMYVDITKYQQIAIDENWANIMSILYRPIERKHGEMYALKPYDGKLRPELFLEVNMAVHFGTLFFFVNLLKDLLNSTLNYTMKMDLPPNIKSTLAKSGEVMQRLLLLQEEKLKR